MQCLIQEKLVQNERSANRDRGGRARTFKQEASESEGSEVLSGNASRRRSRNNGKAEVVVIYDSDEDGPPAPGSQEPGSFVD